MSTETGEPRKVPAGGPATINGVLNQLLWSLFRTSKAKISLRCCIEDGSGEDGLQPTVYIDDQEFSSDDFGKMLCTYAGWGMRIVFVPDDELETSPKIDIRDPND